ncbi:MAG: hypothetical protein Q9198_004530 [Flavoplaca austrocitrina]
MSAGNDQPRGTERARREKPCSDVEVPSGRPQDAQTETRLAGFLTPGSRQTGDAMEVMTGATDHPGDPIETMFSQELQFEEYHEAAAGSTEDLATF